MITDNMKPKIEKVAFSGTASTSGNLGLGVKVSEATLIGFTINATGMNVGTYITGSGEWAMHFTDISGKAISGGEYFGYCYIMRLSEFS